MNVTLTPAQLDALADAIVTRLRPVPGVITPLPSMEQRVRQVLAAVERHGGIPAHQMWAGVRKQPGCFGRQVAMWLTRQTWHLPYLVIAVAFGYRDHGTVMHACTAVQDQMETDPEARRWILAAHTDLIHQTARSLPTPSS